MIQNYTKKNKISFTLAECLIALVIIGIIAAITVPIIMSNYRRAEYSSKIKKFYSTMSQAAIKAKADGNDWDDWANTASKEINESGEIINNFLKQYLFPYIIYTDFYKDSATSLGYYYVILNDGTFFRIAKRTCLDIQFDANGFKGPNKDGVDRYWFLYCPVSDTFSPVKSKFTSYRSTYVTSREKALEQCKSSANYCSGLLEFDSWEYKNDYPYHI